MPSLDAVERAHQINWNALDRFIMHLARDPWYYMAIMGIVLIPLLVVALWAAMELMRDVPGAAERVRLQPFRPSAGWAGAGADTDTTDSPSPPPLRAQAEAAVRGSANPRGAPPPVEGARGGARRRRQQARREE